MLSIIRLISQIFGKKLIKLTEQNLSHSKWVVKKCFFLGGGGNMKNENQIKDENEASYYYAQSAQ